MSWRDAAWLRRHWRPTAVVGAVSLAAVVAGLGALRAQRVEAMRVAVDTAISAVREARTADAMTWAPEELRAAERALQDARLAQRQEQTRFWPVPDAARVETASAEAGRSARRVLSLARERRDTAVSSAASLVDAAGKAVAASAGLAETIRLDPNRRNLLVRARHALTEARVYQREGDFGTATLRAREAIGLAGLVRDHAAAVAARYADAETIARWRRWKEETIAWSRREGRAAVVVEKEAHLLTLFNRGQPVKTYPVDLGFNWIADKSHAGDNATPEGRYRVVARHLGGASIYYKALLLDYPNAEDRTRFSRARRSGELPPSAGIGGLIEIHGEGGRGRDWTRGCIALTNSDMDDLLAHVGVGTPVTIVGSDEHGAIAEFVARHRDDAAGRQH